MPVCGRSPSPGAAPLRWRRNGWLTESQHLTPPISWNQVQHSSMNISILWKHNRPSEGRRRDKFHSCVCPNNDRNISRSQIREFVAFLGHFLQGLLLNGKKWPKAEQWNGKLSQNVLITLPHHGRIAPFWTTLCPPLDGPEWSMESLPDITQGSRGTREILTGCCPLGWSNMFQSSYWLYWTLQFCWIPCCSLVPTHELGLSLQHKRSNKSTFSGLFKVILK